MALCHPSCLQVREGEVLESLSAGRIDVSLRFSPENPRVLRGQIWGGFAQTSVHIEETELNLNPKQIPLYPGD